MRISDWSSDVCSSVYGRTIKLMSDGAHMKFASVVDAVTFAVDVQCSMLERNAEVPMERRIAYRIGINIGDVIVEGVDIYGEGVNVAAGIEVLADKIGRPSGWERGGQAVLKRAVAGLK